MPAKSASMPSDWTTIFYDFTDADTGEPFGVVECRRIIAATRCIGCTLFQTHPDAAVTTTHEVWAGGEREADDVGCFCDRQEAGGVIPWRAQPRGTRAR